MKKEKIHPHLFKTKLVFGLYNIGDIVVSLKDMNTARKTGDIFKVKENSTEKYLDYKNHCSSSYKYHWRLATPEEVKAYCDGITNINDMAKPKTTVEKFLAAINKPEEQVLKESVESFLDDLTVHVETNIARREISLIPTCRNEIKRLNNELSKLQVKAKADKFTIDTPTAYVQNQIDNMNGINRILSSIKDEENKISIYLEEIEMYKEMLKF